MPPIDLDAYRGGTKEVKRAIERELAACMQKYNFCALKDSSFFADDMMDRTYAMVKDLFALPQERKNELAAIAGYSGPGMEKALSAKAADVKEFWHYFRQVPEDNEERQATPMAYYDNVWPSEISEEAAQTLEQRFRAAADSILRIAAGAVNLPEDFLTGATTAGSNVLRFIHYPVLDGSEGEASRAHVHTGAGVLGLLPPATRPGLQVRDRQGNWLVPTGFDDAILVTFADQMELLTNREIWASTHRVVNPESSENTSRYAIVYFVASNPTWILEPHPSLITRENPRRHAPIKAHDFLISRMIEVTKDGDKAGVEVTQNVHQELIRRFPRVTLSSKAQIVPAKSGDAFEALIVDISEAGCFAQCSSSVVVGDHLTISFLVSERELRAKCVVTWKRSDDHPLPGFGVEFGVLAPEASQLIRAKLNERIACLEELWSNIAPFGR